MTNYEAIYEAAYDAEYILEEIREPHEDAYKAGIAAVVAAAKTEALNGFADDLAGYTIDFTTPTRTMDHIVGLARRNAIQ